MNDSTAGGRLEDDVELVGRFSISLDDDGPKQEWWGGAVLLLWSDGTVTWRNS